VFTYRVKVYDEKTDEEKGEFQAVWNAVETNGWSCKSSELFNSEGGYWELGGAPGNFHGIFYEPPDGARACVFTLTHTKGPANPSFFSDEAEGIGWQQKEGGAFPVLPDQGGGHFIQVESRRVCARTDRGGKRRARCAGACRLRSECSGKLRFAHHCRFRGKANCPASHIGLEAALGTVVSYLSGGRRLR
jgi:hypothetical protein